MYKIDHTITVTPVKEYIDNFRDADKFIAICKECRQYNTCWACPPYDFSTDAILAGYSKLYIIGTKITLEIMNNENDSYEGMKEIIYGILAEVRNKLDHWLLELEEKYPDSRVFFGGTCHLCPEGQCTRVEGKPCIHPEQVRHSLESFGFDLMKTSAELLDIELKWSTGKNYPEYLTLISGFLTNQQLQEEAFYKLSSFTKAPNRFLI